MLRSIGKQSGESVESVRKKKRRLRGKDLQKRNVLSLELKNEGVTDDGNGGSMEAIEEAPLKARPASYADRHQWQRLRNNKIK